MTHLGTSDQLLFDLCGRYTNSRGDTPTRTDVDTSRSIINIGQSIGAKKLNLTISKNLSDNFVHTISFINQLNIYLKGNLAGCIPLPVFRRLFEKL